MSPSTLRPGTRATALITIPGRTAFRATILMWADGDTLSTQRTGGTEVFSRKPGMGPDVWQIGGRTARIEVERR